MTRSPDLMQRSVIAARVLRISELPRTSGNNIMNTINTTRLLLVAALLTGCDDIGRAFNPTEILEVNGETYVIDQSTGNVSVVAGLQLKPLELQSTEIFTLGSDVTLGSTTIDFEFLISGSQVYWSGKITPNIGAEEFESDEEREAFLDLWRRNINQSGNYISFEIQPFNLGIAFGKLFISMSEVNVTSQDLDGNISKLGSGVKTVNLEYRLIESQGGTVSLYVSPTYVLEIED